MSYPPTKPDATYFDSDSDRISESRAELKTAVDAINTVIDTIDTSGIINGQGLVWNSTGGKFEAGNLGNEDGVFSTSVQDLGTITDAELNDSAGDSTPFYVVTQTQALAKIVIDVSVDFTLYVHITDMPEWSTWETVVTFNTGSVKTVGFRYGIRDFYNSAGIGVLGQADPGALGSAGSIMKVHYRPAGNFDGVNTKDASFAFEKIDFQAQINWT